MNPRKRPYSTTSHLSLRTQQIGLISLLCLGLNQGCGGYASSHSQKHNPSSSGLQTKQTEGKEQAMNQSNYAQSAFAKLSSPGPMQEIKLGQVRLSFFDSGSQGTVGAPIVLLHGLGEHAGYWDENVPTLIAAHRRVIVPDLAGHGRSSKEPGHYSMSLQAKLINALLDQLKLSEPVILVGHSMGGHIALRFSRSYPSRVQRLVLISPAGIERFTAEESAWLNRVSTVSTLASRSPSDLRAHFKRNIFGLWGRAAEAHLNERFTLNKDPQFLDYIRAVVSSIQGMLNDRVAYELNQVEVPTYLMMGAEDRLIPNPYLHGGRAKDIIVQAQKQFPNLIKAVLLPQIGHMPQIEAPRQVENFILNSDQLETQKNSKQEANKTKPNQAQDFFKSESGFKSKGSRGVNSMTATLIKRYPNRRLYDTERSAYITLDDLADDLAQGAKVKVIDSKSKEDITQRVILQALLTDQHAHKLNCLPADFLQTVFQLEDPTLRALFNHYVRVTLSSFAIAQGAVQQNLDLVKKLAPRPSDFLKGLTHILKPSDRS